MESLEQTQEKKSKEDKLEQAVAEFEDNADLDEDNEENDIMGHLNFIKLQKIKEDFKK